MEKYDVYGIGNALVDMEFEVDPPFLEKMSIDKGIMTLVDEKRQEDILEKLDIALAKKCCGGSAANTIIAVTQFGGKSFYSCKVANDETGDFYFRDLEQHGVVTNLRGARPEGTTGKCMVFVTPDADRTMNTYLGITAGFSKDEVVEGELKKANYLYIEGYLLTSPNGKEAALYAKSLAKQNNVKTSLTFSDPAVVEHFHDSFVEVLDGGVDLLFCNEAEALNFTKKETVEEAAEELKKWAKSFAITRGPKGALIYHESHENYITVEAPEIHPVDTNGAGDLFAGSFLYAINNGHSFEEAGTLACHAASKLVTQFGARLKDHEAREVLNSIFK
jgi:sugar/nucleoside kinase (ribokinase family)